MGTDSARPTDTAGLDGVERELALLFRRAYGISAAIAEEIHPGLGPATYGTLALIAARGPVRGADISELLGLDKSTVSRQLRDLVDNGLVERTVDPADRRNSLAQLTKDGRRRLKLARDGRRRRLRRQLSAWAPGDLDSFASMLQRLNATD